MDAKTARKLAGVPEQEVALSEVQKIEKNIKEAAEKKQRMIYLWSPFWLGGYNSDPTWKEAVKILEARGFTVKFRYEERQFVDMGTEIHW